MKIFPTTSIKQLDADTIENEPIASIDLMERASRALARAIAERWEPDTPLTVFAGPGNNGGDALALARLLAGKGYRLEVYLFNTKGTLSPDCETNKERLADVTESSGQTLSQTEEIARRIQSANEQMSALSSAMDDISGNAQQITKIAKDIGDIAFQTNLLAINASVEAARAGAAGKGFAVVADEVKQLAAKSAEAAQSATDMVNNTKTIIQTGVELTADTAGSLRAISDVSAQINTISDQLTAAVRGQELALAAMEERIASISAIADRNLQNAGETEQSSGSLAREAEALQSQVRKFILKEDGRG